MTTGNQSTKPTVAIYGAYGHTARFIADDLRSRGFRLVLAGRDEKKVAAVARDGDDVRLATIDAPASLDSALAGAEVVVNCAGPFAESIPVLVDAAARAGIHYVDITAEIFVSLDAFERYRPRFDGAAFAVMPSVGFYGVLGDLAVTVLSEGWPDIDEVTLAVALDFWHPTKGTRLAGERRGGRRLVLTDGRLEAHEADQPAPHTVWVFPPPFDRQDVVGEFAMVDLVTMSRHLTIKKVNTYLNTAVLEALSDPTTPPPQAASPDGRSAQTYVLDVVVRRGDEERRLSLNGRDIYGVTGPIVGEVVERLAGGRLRHGGVATAAEIFEPRDFLDTLAAAGHFQMHEYTA